MNSIRRQDVTWKSSFEINREEAINWISGGSFGVRGSGACWCVGGSCARGLEENGAAAEGCAECCQSDAGGYRSESEQYRQPEPVEGRAGESEKLAGKPAEQSEYESSGDGCQSV